MEIGLTLSLSMHRPKGTTDVAGQSSLLLESNGTPFFLLESGTLDKLVLESSV